MIHPLANAAFLVAGLVAIAATAVTVIEHWPEIRKALGK